MGALQAIEPRYFEFINGRGHSAEATESKKAKPTIAELRKMSQDRAKAAWIGLALTAATQAVIFSAWMGTLSERVAAADRAIGELSQEQKTRAPIIYSIPSMQQSVAEIKSDVKDLKQMMLMNQPNKDGANH